MSEQPHVADPEAWREPTTRGLLVLAALGSVAASVGALRALGDPATATPTAAWRGAAAVFLATVYLYLGIRPIQRPGVWELVIGHRVLTAGLIGYLAVNGAEGAWLDTGANVALALVLAGAYVVTRAHHAWDRFGPD